MEQLLPEDLSDIRVGELVLLCIGRSSGAAVHRLTVAEVSAKRFVAVGPLAGRQVRLTFRKVDGRSIGGKQYNWARRPSV